MPKTVLKAFRITARLADGSERVLAQENARLELRFEVQATSPGGFSQGALRDISENCRTLKIADFGFEEE